MTAIAYTSQQDYVKFLSQKAKEQCGEGCGCSGSSTSQDCGCCPSGLVAIYDDKGQHLGCLTPNDAELFKKNIITCEAGYVKLFNNGTGEFLGCVSEDTYAALNDNVNGTDSVSPVGLELIPSDSVLQVGEIRTFYGRFSPLNTTNQDVVFISSDASVGTISADGIFEALHTGSTTVKVTSVADPLVNDQRVITVIAAVS